MTNTKEQYLVFVSSFLQVMPALSLAFDDLRILDFHHFGDPDQLRLCWGSQHQIAFADRHGWTVAQNTNQSGILLFYFGLFHVENFNQSIHWMFGEKALIAYVHAMGYGHNLRASVVQLQEKCRGACEIVVASGLQLFSSFEKFPFPLLKQTTSAPQ